jgi:magnesium chelatase family protein
MTLALAHSRARTGVHAPAVRVEVYLAAGLPALNIVGLPEAAVRESRDRVRAAIQCAQFEFPSRRITVNLAPADLPKDGGRFDLPIALGILAASGVVDVQALGRYEFLGELALTGELRAIDGVLPAALAAARAGRALIVPADNGAEAALAGKIEAYTARTLLEVVAHLNREKALPLAQCNLDSAGPIFFADLADVRGQFQARRALEIAAAGAHHLIFIGPPGCGKTLLASRLPGLLPEASEAEALESAVIASVSGRGLDLTQWRVRSFRAPHHTASAIALVGG